MRHPRQLSKQSQPLFIPSSVLSPTASNTPRTLKHAALTRNDSSLAGFVHSVPRGQRLGVRREARWGRPATVPSGEGGRARNPRVRAEQNDTAAMEPDGSVRRATGQELSRCPGGRRNGRGGYSGAHEWMGKRTAVGLSLPCRTYSLCHDFPLSKPEEISFLCHFTG